MADSTILKIPLIANSQVDQYDVANDAIGFLEAAENDFLSVDLSSGDGTVTNTVSDDYAMLRNFMFVGTGHTVARSITFSANKRQFAVQNDGTDVLSVTIGSSTIAIPAGDAYLFYADGTTNGLVRIT